MSPLVRAAFAAVVLAAAPMPAARAAAPVPGDAGKAITFPFPAKAPVVVQVNGHGAARDRLAAMLKNAVPDDVAEVTKLADEGIKELLGDRKLTAVPKDGRIFFVVNDIAALFDSRYTLSLLVPVTSYKEFRESFLTADERKAFEPGRAGVDEAKMTFFGEEHAAYMVDLKEYVAITPDKATAEGYAAKYTKATTAAMPAELAKSFVIGDLAVYVNLDVINDLHGEQIRAFRGLIDFALQQGAMGGMIPGLDKKQIEAAKVIIHGAFQAVEDARGAVLSVEFRPEGLNVRLQAQFADDTTSARVIKTENPGPLADVGKFPAGMGQYGGSKFGKKFQDAVRGLSPEFSPADEESTAALAKQQKELYAAGPLGDISASSPPNVSVTVGSYTDPAKAVAAIAGSYEAMTAGGRVMAAVLKDAPKAKAGAQKHQGFTFTEIKLAFDFDATVKDLPDGVRESTRAQLKNNLSEKTTVWVGTDGKSVVQALGNWDAVAAALDGYLDGKKTIADTAGYKLTRKNLPPEASYLMLMETGQTLTALMESARAMEGAIPGFPKVGAVKPLKGDASFIGMAATFKGDAATFNLFVPAAAVGTARKMLDGVIKKND